MRLSKTLLPIIATVVGALVTGITATVSAAHPTATPAVPSGFQRIVDDTGTISAAVPTGWTVDTARFNVEHDGVGFPSIVASPGRTPAGCEGCSEGWLLPTFEVVAEPYRDLSTESECNDPETVPFDTGSFAGFRRNGVGCDMWVDEVLASEASGALNLRVAMVYAGPVGTEEPVMPVEAAKALFDVMLEQIEWTGAPFPTAPASLPPADPADPSSSIWPYGPFWNVPQLGSEPVRGTGCGSQGQIGDVIPDGLWAGYVTNESTPTISIDLLCIFTGAAAGHVVSEGTANIVNNEPDYLVVNNNTRLRSAPAAPGIVLRDSSSINGECVENPAAAHNPAPARQAWIRIDGGQVTWILWGCGFPAIPAAPQPANLAPAYPDYGDGVGSVWPYGPFWNVPQLGREPVRGSGCGASGQLGATIPDGLWAGFVTGYDASTNAIGIDVLCIFAGESAQAVIAEGTANIINNEPDYLIVNNNPQVRAMPSGLAAIITGEFATDGQCVEGTHHSPEAVDGITARTNQQAWIRIANGLVTWIFYGC
jgi:hypothetical protein